MSLARDLGRALGLTKGASRSKALPRQLPRSFGDELLSREYRQAVERHQAAIRELRASRRLQDHELRLRCRERVASTRAAAWEVYRSAQEAARARRRGEIAQVRDTCKAGRIEALAPTRARLEGELAGLAERRQERRAYLARERSASAKARRIATKGKAKAMTVAEERGAVRAALEVEAPELVSLWDRVGPTLRATPRRTLREAFLDWAHEHPEEVTEAREEEGRGAEAEAIAELERQQREAYGIPDPEPEPKPKKPKPKKPKQRPPSVAAAIRGGAVVGSGASEGR